MSGDRLDDVSTAEIRAELGRRRAAEDAGMSERWRTQVRDLFGVCQALPGITYHPLPEGPCGAEFVAYEMKEIRPILQSPPGWVGWGFCPPERCWQVGAEYEIKLTCGQGHETFLRRTKIFEVPLKPLF